jgi:hypothetical protein
MEDERKAPDVEKRDENEGEGSKSADAAYRRDVDKFLEEEDPAKLGRQAKEDVERDPERYAEAERQGKARIAEEDEKDKDLI